MERRKERRGQPSIVVSIEEGDEEEPFVFKKRQHMKGALPCTISGNNYIHYSKDTTNT
jgi:hypothetical protein